MGTFVVSVLQKYEGVFIYLVAFDLEDKMQQKLVKQELTDMIIAFGDTLENTVFYCFLHSNLS